MNNKKKVCFLELKNIEILIGQRVLLKEAHFSFTKGEWALLLGSNGSGKTTLLKLIAGRWAYWKGSLIINGHEYTSSTWNSFKAHENGIVLLDQLPELPESLRVWEFLTWGLEELNNSFYLKRSSIENLIKEKIKVDFFYSLPLESFLKDLKEGERFKLLILSAILRAKNLILWDESTIFLNSYEKESLFSLIESLSESGISHLMVTHENFIWKDKVLRKFFIDSKDLYLKEGSPSPISYSKKLPFQNKEAYSPLFEISLKRLSLKVNKGEIVALISKRESFLRDIEEVVIGNNSLKEGEFLTLEGENISSLTFSQRRKKIGYVKAWLGLREEPSFFSLLFPNILKRGKFLVEEKDLLFLAKERVPPSFYRRLETPWKFLSGGEKQSLILEREISNNPSFLLVPFPFQGLDQKSIESFMIKLKKFSLLRGALILSTEASEVSLIANRLVFEEDF